MIWSEDTAALGKGHKLLVRPVDSCSSPTKAHAQLSAMICKHAAKLQASLHPAFEAATTLTFFTGYERALRKTVCCIHQAQEASASLSASILSRLPADRGWHLQPLCEGDDGGKLARCHQPAKQQELMPGGFTKCTNQAMWEPLAFNTDTARPLQIKSIKCNGVDAAE